MMSTKRIILADGPRLLREMLHRAIDQADHLKVVDEVPKPEELALAIEQFAPEWVIVGLPYSDHTHSWARSCMTDYPSVRFIFISPHQDHIKMKWQSAHEEDYSDLSLRDFIQILERDLQHS